VKNIPKKLGKCLMAERERKKLDLNRREMPKQAPEVRCHNFTEVALGFGAKVIEMVGIVEARATFDVVADFSRFFLVDLDLTQTWALSHDVGGQVDAGDEATVTTDQKIGHPPAHFGKPRKCAATRTGARCPGSHVADPVADERHSQVHQVGHKSQE